MTCQSRALTWGNELRIALSCIFICTSARGVPMFSPSPPPASCRRGCTVPGEGWSPAETEHSGEAPRRRRSPLWCRVRSASPLAAARIGTRSTRGDRQQSRRRHTIARGAFFVLRRCPALASGELRSGCSRVAPRRRQPVRRHRRPHLRPRRRHHPSLPSRGNRRRLEVLAVPVTTTTAAPKAAPVVAPPVATASRRAGTGHVVQPRPLLESAPARRFHSEPC